MTNISRRSFLSAAALAGAAAAPRRPNILIVFSDQQHWRAMGAMDRFFSTPHLDALSAEGTLFERSFCTTPQCSPSRSSLLTGCYPSTTGVFGNVGASGGNPLRTKTLGALLQDAGYYTGYFGKWHLGKEAAGTAGWNERGFEQNDEQARESAVRFLEARARGSQPFALMVSFLDPHDVYQFRPGAKDVSGLSIPLPDSWEKETFTGKPAVHKEFMTADQGTLIWDHPRRDWQEYRDFYRGKVALYDRHLGRVLAALKQAGAWDNTIIAATSDHGDMDTNHKLIFKGPFLYEHMVRIPLVMRVPALFGGKGARRETALDVVNTDLAPTLAEFAGARVPDCHGISLKPVLTGAANQKTRPFVIGQYYGKQRWVNPMRMLRTSEYKYNRLASGAEELYDLKNDPGELVNLAADAGRARIRKEYAAQLEEWMTAHHDPFPSQKATTRNGEPL